MSLPFGELPNFVRQSLNFGATLLNGIATLLNFVRQLLNFLYKNRQFAGQPRLKRPKKPDFDQNRHFD